MSVLSVRFSDEKYAALEKYAQINGVSMNEALKSTFFDMLEDQFDMMPLIRPSKNSRRTPKPFLRRKLLRNPVYDETLLS